MQIAAQWPVVDHCFNGLDYLANLISAKESIPGNDPSNHNPCVYKHLFRFKGGTATLISNKHVLCAISKSSTLFFFFFEK